MKIKETMTAEALRRMMKRNGWKHQDLADACVRDRRTVNRWVKDEQAIPKVAVRHIRRLDSVGCRLDWWHK